MTSNELQTALKIITTSFKFLETNGFEVEISQQDYPFILENIQVEYTNQSKARKVIVSYQKSNINGATKYSFSASVVRLPYRTPYEDYFSFEEYFNSIGDDFIRAIYNKFEDQEAEVAVQKLATFLQKNAAIFVEGEEWVKGYYPKWS